MLEICFGWEPREALGVSVFEFSAVRRTSQPLRFIPLMEQGLRYNGLYTRPHEQRDGQLWCPISQAPMATSFANSRFLVPWLVDGDWALFCDGADMLFLADPAELFALADRRYAVQVVKRDHEPAETVKMDGQKQTSYSRKNWSSLILWNLRHKAHRRLSKDDVNTLPGRELHRFCWLENREIGSLPPAWNYLVGVDPDASSLGVEPKLLHYTLGIPTMEGYADGPWAETWRRELSILESTRGKLPWPAV